MKAARAFVVACLLSVYRLRPTGGVREFAESEVFIPKSESNDYGGRMYSTDLTPWVRLLLKFATDPEWKEFIHPKSGQSGITLAALCIVLYYIRHRLGNVLYAIDSVSEARRISRARLQPLVKACRSIAEDIAEKEDEITNLTFYLQGMAVYLIGAFAEGAWLNKSIILAILDELDRHDVLPSGQTTIDAARTRLKRQENGKLIGFGTPEGEIDVTWTEFLTGTRHKLHVPCPHCGHRQELVIEQLDASHCKDMLGEYDLERVEKETVYRCCNCAKAIEEKDKAGMLAAVADDEYFGYVQTNHGQDEHKPVPGKMSAHISDLYSTFPTCTWGIIMREYIEAQRSPAKLTKLYNDRLGLPRPEARTEIKGADILAMCGTYGHGVCPVRPACVIMGVDVQKEVKKWVKLGFSARGEAWVIDYGFTLSYDDLLAEADAPIPIADSMDAVTSETEHVTVDFGIIDEGHDTMNVREFCSGSNGLFHPCKGRPGLSVRDVVDEKTNYRHNGLPITVFHFSDDDFKRALYEGTIGKFKQILSGKAAIPRLWFPYKPEAEFVSELCQEKRGQVMKKGRLTWVWLDPAGPNDFGDAVKECYVAWYAVKKFYAEQVSPEKEKQDVPAEPDLRLSPMEANAARWLAVQLARVEDGVPVEWFDDDHAPVGPQLRASLVAKGVAREQGGVVLLA